MYTRIICAMLLVLMLPLEAGAKKSEKHSGKHSMKGGLKALSVEVEELGATVSANTQAISANSEAAASNAQTASNNSQATTANAQSIADNLEAIIMEGVARQAGDDVHNAVLLELQNSLALITKQLAAESAARKASDEELRELIAGQIPEVFTVKFGQAIDLDLSLIHI